MNDRFRGIPALTVLCVFVASTFLTAQSGSLRDFGNRLEGTAARQNALNDWQLLGLHRSVVVFGPNAQLRVRLFAPQGASRINLEAVELQDFKHYVMRSKESYRWNADAWNTFQPWPTADVIDVLGVKGANMAVLATYTAPGERLTVLPVDVFADALPRASPVYTAYFRTGRDIQTITVTMTLPDGRAAKPPDIKTCNRSLNPSCRLYAAGSTQALDVDGDGVSAGVYRVAITETIPNSSDKISPEFWLYHMP
jgi:hypothetical protein